jgi:hypothetical protein
MDLAKLKTKEEILTFLKSGDVKANINKLIAEKKVTLKLTQSISNRYVDSKDDLTDKALFTKNTDNLDTGELNRTILANIYYWMDSHEDVHVKNTFKKSIEERKGQIEFFHDHENKVVARIGKINDIYEKRVDWGDLGINVTGKTTALMADVTFLERLNESTYNQVLNEEINQYSVGMRYVIYKFAMRSDDPDLKEQNDEYNKHIDLIGNKQKVEEQGYYFAIYEAKLIEVSAVTRGSNELTCTLPNQSKKSEVEEPSNDTQQPIEIKEESSADTQQKQFINLNLI